MIWRLGKNRAGIGACGLGGGVEEEEEGPRARPPPPRFGAQSKQGHPRGHAGACRLARPGLRDGAHLRTRPALLAWHGAPERQALVWREVTHQRVGLGKGHRRHPLSPSEVELCFFYLFVLFLIPSDWPPTKSGFQMPSRGELERGTVELSRHLFHPIAGACLLSAGPLSPGSAGSGVTLCSPESIGRSLGPANVLPATALFWTTFEGCNR